MGIGSNFSYALERKYIKIRDNIFFAPYFQVQNCFEDNVFSQEDNPKSDKYWTIDIGGDLKLLYRKYNFQILPLLRVIRFSKYHSQNSTNIYLTSKVNIDFNRFLSLGIEDIFKKFAHRTWTEDISRIKRRSNIFSFVADLRFPRTFFQLQYQNLLTHYLTDRITDVVGSTIYTYKDNNSIENRISLLGGRKILSPLSLIVAVNSGKRDYKYPKRSDYFYIEYLAGIQYNLSSHISLDFRGGYRNQDYESDEYEKFEGYVIYGNTQIDLNPYTSFSLSVSKGANSSIYKNMGYYSYQRIDLRLNHTLRANTKWKIGIDGFFQYSKYPQPSIENGEMRRRKDKYWQANFWTRFYPKNWWSIELRISHSQRDSVFRSYSFKNNSFILSVKVFY